MLAFILLLFAESSHGGGGAFSNFYHTYLNYPGFEAWRFINLAIFAGILIYLLKKPLSDVFKAKREEIRAELIKAEQEKESALATLAETEAKIARLDSEKENILVRAKQEAEAEASRIKSEADNEVKKIRAQADNEILRTANQAKQELRKLSAEETIRRAEELIKQKLDKANDAGLVKAGIESLGGAK